MKALSSSEKQAMDQLNCDHSAITQSGSLSYYVAPNYRGAKTIAWVALKDLLPEGFIKGKHESELTVTFQNDSKIALKGADNPDSLPGVSFDSCVLDKAAFFKDLESATSHAKL